MRCAIVFARIGARSSGRRIAPAVPGHTACDSSGMPKTTIATATPCASQLDRLADFEPTDWPVLSLYLDMRPDQNGRRTHDIFLRKVFPERSRALHGDARKSFERDVERIRAYLESEVPPSVRGLAMFACSAADGFFEAFQLAAPFDHHSLFIGSSSTSLSAGARNRSIPRLRRAARRHEFGAAVRVSAGTARRARAGDERQDTAERVRRMVAGAIPAPLRELLTCIT